MSMVDSSLRTMKDKDWVCIHPFPARSVAMTEFITILPKLTDENKIGHGGSREMYKIIFKPDQSSSGEYMVVKKIPNKKDLNLKPQEIPEVEILEKIKHPNIMEMTGCFRNSTSTLLLLPYFKNGSLADCLLHRDQAVVLDWGQRIHIACGVAEALKYMHHDYSSVVLHKNLKSSNILLDDDFNPKIADFKFAEFVERNGREYAKTTEGEKKEDVYNFGVILLELLMRKEDKKKQPLAKRAHAVKDTAINDILDDAVIDNQKDACSVFKHAIWCTQKQAKDRPDMKEVLMLLQKIKF